MVDYCVVHRSRRLLPPPNQYNERIKHKTLQSRWRGKYSNATGLLRTTTILSPNGMMNLKRCRVPTLRRSSNQALRCQLGRDETHYRLISPPLRTKMRWYASLTKVERRRFDPTSGNGGCWLNRAGVLPLLGRPRPSFVPRRHRTLPCVHCRISNQTRHFYQAKATTGLDARSQKSDLLWKWSDLRAAPSSRAYFA